MNRLAWTDRRRRCAGPESRVEDSRGDQRSEETVGSGDCSLGRDPALDVKDDVDAAVGVIDVDVPVGTNWHLHQVGHGLVRDEVQVRGRRPAGAGRPDGEIAPSGRVGHRHV